MICLYKNELVKIIKRPLFFGIFFFITIVCIAHGFIHLTQPDEIISSDSNWKNDLLHETIYLEDILDGLELDDANRYKLEVNIKTNRIMYDHDIAPDDWRALLILEYILIQDEQELLSEDELDNLSRLENIIFNCDWEEYFNYFESTLLDRLSVYDKDSYAYESGLLEIERINALRLYFEPNEGKGWKDGALISYLSNCDALLLHKYFATDPDYFLLPNEIHQIETQNKILLYRIQNNIAENQHLSFAGYLNDIFSIRVIITLSIILLAHICVSSEFEYGTIQNLFSFPYKRHKILTSKIITVLSAGLVLYVLFSLVSLLSAWAIYRELPSDAILFFNGEVSSINYIAFFFITLILSFFETIIFALLSILLSLAIKTPAASLTLVTIFAVLSKPVLRYLSTVYRLKILKYIPFASFDLNQFLFHDVIVNGLTLSLAIVINVISIIIILLLSYLLFVEREL